MGAREKKGTGSVGEAEEKGAGRVIPNVAESGKNRGKLRNIAQYSAIEKAQKDGRQQR